MKTFTILLLLACLVVPVLGQDAGRAKCSCEWPEGKATIVYGSPAWKQAFQDHMDGMKEKGEGMAWRLGNNDPTEFHCTFGVMTPIGPMPAGKYKMALHLDEKGTWHLAIYEGNGQYSVERPAWHIAPTTSSKDNEPGAKNLTLKLNDNKQLEVHFGPHKVCYALSPIKMHEPVETEFAFIPARVDVMALPVEKELKDVNVGTARITKNGVAVQWNMHLTIAGENATLKFVHNRTKGIDAERTEIKSNLKRVKSRLEGANEQMAERIAAFVARQEKALESLDAESRLVSTYQSEKEFKGTIKDLETTASTLQFSHERPEGGIVFKFDAGNKSASFDINPRQFRAPRR